MDTTFTESVFHNLKLCFSAEKDSFALKVLKIYFVFFARPIQNIARTRAQCLVSNPKKDEVHLKKNSLEALFRGDRWTRVEVGYLTTPSPEKKEVDNFYIYGQIKCPWSSPVIQKPSGLSPFWKSDFIPSSTPDKNFQNTSPLDLTLLKKNPATPMDETSPSILPKAFCCSLTTLQTAF